MHIFASAVSAPMAVHFLSEQVYSTFRIRPTDNNIILVHNTQLYSCIVVIFLQNVFRSRSHWIRPKSVCRGETTCHNLVKIYTSSRITIFEPCALVLYNIIRLITVGFHVGDIFYWHHARVRTRYYDELLR